MNFFDTWLLAPVPIMGMMTLLWIVSVFIRNVSIVDLFWGFGFVLTAWFYAAWVDVWDTRTFLLLALVTVWGLRLTIYLSWRNIGKGEDFRYQEFRQQYGAERYWWFSFFQVFVLQGALMWLISAPLLGAMYLAPKAGLNALDYIGVFVWAIGFAFEAGGDYQLARFKANPANKGKVLDTGFWRYTRHPNYFGDSAVWWGFGLICVAAGSYWPVLGAVLMTGLIVKVSGVALLEGSLKKTKPQYAEYVRRTSAFFPWWPRG